MEETTAQVTGKWNVISENCALQWHKRELACRLFEKPLPLGVNRRPTPVPPRINPELYSACAAVLGDRR